MRSLARVTLANFGLLLFLSLFIVIPQDASALRPELLAAGIFSLGVIAPSLIAAGRSPTRTLRSYQLVFRFGLSAIGYGGVVLAGALLGRGSVEGPLNLLVAVTLILLVCVASQQLGSAGERRRRHAGRAARGA